MFDLNLWLLALLPAVGIAVSGWLVSLVRRDVSIVDSLWSLMFLAAALTYLFSTVTPAPRALLLIVLVAIWAIRLSAYITWRNRGEGEDSRYQEIRRNNSPNFAVKSLYLVFGLQAVLAWFISLPLLAGIHSETPLSLLDAVGVILWTVGFFFEAVGDFQLSRFKADPANKGQVLDSGLWRYTRHPNYFGEFCIWWGFYCLATAAGGWWAFPAPLLMSFLLLKVSGVALLEKDIGERRPAYAEYIDKTNAFFPGPRND